MSDAREVCGAPVGLRSPTCRGSGGLVDRQVKVTSRALKRKLSRQRDTVRMYRSDSNHPPPRFLMAENTPRLSRKRRECAENTARNPKGPATAHWQAALAVGKDLIQHY